MSPRPQDGHRDRCVALRLLSLGKCVEDVVRGRIGVIVFVSGVVCGEVVFDRVIFGRFGFLKKNCFVFEFCLSLMQV